MCILENGHSIECILKTKVQVQKEPMAAGLALLSRSPDGQTWGVGYKANFLRSVIFRNFQSFQNTR